jgi:hypothetical protein
VASTQWVILIDRGQADLYETLQRAFREEPSIKIAWDRRQASSPGRAGGLADRRRSGRPVAVCYVATGSPVADLPRTRPAGEAAGPGSLVCRVCGATCSYEVPTFPQAPARLDVSVTHGGPYQHTVEIQAFTATGRLLLSHRARAIVRRES